MKGRTMAAHVVVFLSSAEGFVEGAASASVDSSRQSGADLLDAYGLAVGVILDKLHQAGELGRLMQHGQSSGGTFFKNLAWFEAVRVGPGEPPPDLAVWVARSVDERNQAALDRVAGKGVPRGGA